MTFSEKLHFMETLWDDLTRVPENYPSPAWHREALEDCRHAAETGEEQFTDWDATKEETRRQAVGYALVSATPSIGINSKR